MASSIRQSEKAPRYFERRDGSAFVPIGLNIAFQRFLGDDEEKTFAAYERQFSALEANSGNFARLWLGLPFIDVEPEREGCFDPIRARRLATIAKIAGRHGIQLKITLGHFRDLKAGCQKELFPGAPSFANDVHRPERGGSCESMEDYLSSKQGRAAFVARMAYIANALKDARNIMAVELWNEVNAVSAPEQAWKSWTEAMLPEIKRLFPDSLAIQSLGSFDSASSERACGWLCSLADNDCKQAHRYLDLGAELDVCRGPLDILCSDAVAWLLAHGPERPAILAEAGAVEPCHSAPSKLYALDKEGVMLHDILFAPFFSGSAGTGQAWHWDFYVERNALWSHFKRFAEAIEGVDPIARRLVPLRLDGSGLRVYALKGRGMSLLWCRDASSDWRSELVEGKPAQLLENLSLDLGSLEGRAEAYCPWSGERLEAVREGATLKLPPFRRSIVVKLIEDSSI